MSRVAVALVLSLSLFACKKKDDGGGAKPAPAALPPTADGVRRVAIEAGSDGYKPDRIEGAPGEKLDLVFTRTVDGECLAQVKVGTGPLIDLPKGKPVDVPVTVPTSGQLAFACGMDMSHGVIVAK